MQAVVVYPEMVSYLMDHGNGHFVDDFLAGAADVQDGLAEDGDPVRQGSGLPPGIALRQGTPS
jgi:hypothetical protein